MAALKYDDVSLQDNIFTGAIFIPYNNHNLDGAHLCMNSESTSESFTINFAKHNTNISLNNKKDYDDFAEMLSEIFPKLVDMQEEENNYSDDDFSWLVSELHLE